MRDVGHDTGAVGEHHLATRPVVHRCRCRDDPGRLTVLVEDEIAGLEVGHGPPTERGRHLGVERQRLPFQPCDEVVGELRRARRRAEDELPGVEDEGVVVVDLDQLGEVVLGLLRVDERRRVVAEHPEVAVDVEVDRARLHARVVERVDDDAARRELFPEGLVGEDHGPDSSEQPSRRSGLLRVGGRRTR